MPAHSARRRAYRYGRTACRADSRRSAGDWTGGGVAGMPSDSVLAGVGQGHSFQDSQESKDRSAHLSGRYDETTAWSHHAAEVPAA